MDLKEIRQLKSEVEKEIVSLINKFEISTTTTVESISITHTSFGAEREEVGIRLKVTDI